MYIYSKLLPPPKRMKLTCHQHAHVFVVQQAEWVGKNLGPALDHAGLGHLKVMVLDDNRIFLPKWVDNVSYSDDLLECLNTFILLTLLWWWTIHTCED